MDLGSLGLYYASRPSARVVSDLPLTHRCESAAAATASRQKCTATVRLTADEHVVALWPRVRTGKQSIEVAARTPDGGIQVLLLARDIPVDWPTP